MRKTEITIEVDRTVTIRQRSGNRPCPECIDRADMVSPAERAEAARRNECAEHALAKRVVGRNTLQPVRQARSKAPMLTREVLDGLLAYLDSDRERAGQKYELIRRKLVKFFECRGCASPEEYADATIDRVAVRIAADVSIYSSDPYSYFYGVARNVLKDYWRHSKKGPLSLQDMGESVCGSVAFVGAVDSEPDQKTEERLSYLDQCLQNLPPECREMIKQYYEAQGGTNIDSRKQLAARMGIPLNALRVRVHRVRARLKQSISEFLCEEAQ